MPHLIRLSNSSTFLKNNPLPDTMSEPSPSSLTPPHNRARASSTSRRPALTLHTCSSRKRGSSVSSAVDPPLPDTPTDRTPPSENKQQSMTLPSLFSRSLQMLDSIKFVHPSPTPSADESLLPTMALSPTLSSFTDSFKEKDSSCSTRNPSVCIKFPARVVDRVANPSLFLAPRHTSPLYL